MVSAGSGGDQELGEGEVTGQALDLGRRDGVALQAEAAGRLEGGDEGGVDLQSRPPASWADRSRPSGTGSVALTITGPSWTPALSSSVKADSMVSLTGISSGRVTRITRQREGSARSSTTSVAWLRTGPPRAALTRPLAEVRKVMAWPVAGASTTIRSATPSRSSCLTLPRTSTSRMPGMAVDTTSTTPELTSRLETRRRPWSSRYSTRASSGVIRRARTVPCSGRRAGWSSTSS